VLASPPARCGGSAPRSSLGRSWKWPQACARAASRHADPGLKGVLYRRCWCVRRLLGAGQCAALGAGVRSLSAGQASCFSVQVNPDGRSGRRVLLQPAVAGSPTGLPSGPEADDRYFQSQATRCIAAATGTIRTRSFHRPRGGEISRKPPEGILGQAGQAGLAVPWFWCPPGAIASGKGHWAHRLRAVFRARRSSPAALIVIPPSFESIASRPSGRPQSGMPLS